MARHYWENHSKVNIALKTSLAKATAKEKKKN